MKKNIIFILYIICLIISSCKQFRPSNSKVEEKKMKAIKISEEIYSEVLEPIEIESNFNENDKIKK